MKPSRNVPASRGVGDKKSEAEIELVTAEESEQPTPATSEIAALAYEYYQQRGCTGGSDIDDWLRAEQELRRRVAETSPGGAEPARDKHE